MAKKAKKVRSDDSEANSEKVKLGKNKKKAGKKAKTGGKAGGQAEVLSSETVFDGPLFRVREDRLIEPGGKEAVRDVVRHNGSAVILAVDNSKE